jgi:hypothetical protein
MTDRSILVKRAVRVTCHTREFPAEQVFIMGWPRGVLKTVEF